MKPNPPDFQEASCHGLRFYRSRHSSIRRLKKLYAPTLHGHRIWDSSWLLIDYLSCLGLPSGLKVMEVGCGWGLAGIFCAKSLRAALTSVDADPRVFPFLNLHADLNGVRATTRQGYFQELTTGDLTGTDILLGADICFWDEQVEPLLGLMTRALAAGVAMILLADPGREPFERLAAGAGARFGARAFSLDARRPHALSGRLLKIAAPPFAA